MSSPRCRERGCSNSLSSSSSSLVLFSPRVEEEVDVVEEEAEGAGAGVMPDDVDASGTVPPAAGLRTAAGGIRVEDDGGGLDAAPFVVDREDEPPKIEGTLSCTGCTA